MVPVDILATESIAFVYSEISKGPSETTNRSCFPVWLEAQSIVLELQIIFIYGKNIKLGALLVISQLANEILWANICLTLHIEADCGICSENKCSTRRNLQGMSA